MSGIIRILLIIGAILLFLYMIKKIRQSKVKIEALIFWLAFSILLIFMGIFSSVVYWVSDLLGFQSPISFVFLVIIFILIVKNFFMTIQISQLEHKVDELTQRIAIDRKRDNDSLRKDGE